ncbi:LysR family transcriptional regulator [Lichenifustis flavocetrariae]|uniref:LysR family transcriptional regulator n=1 Tax=Lichenifustis flavocetrariae TaxID=2949735 RepID=A0AA41Z959_9HYPH|nr:LysR family transcriptional regulator [Lichenifustis flavocetrariae]MCW6511622.1 LysR family transcriptional regulator [Lichenifustis flavocetrariae]
MIDKFEYLLALSRERHFGRAAESCGVTQPTLSAGLKSLEEALGVLIVNRASRFQGFTPEGERVLAWARRIVADTQAMRQDIGSLKRGLTGHLRLAVIPTALPVVARLTVPFQAKHPDVQFSILSTTSDRIRQLLQDLEIDAGITYLDNEALGPMRTVPLYAERYRLVTSLDGPFAGRVSVTWAEAGQVPLCLLTPDMQNRRIIDDTLRACGREPVPTLVSNSTIVLVSHVKTGRWSTILPPILAESLGHAEPIRAIPITDPDIAHAVGLVVLRREPATPLVTALVAESRAAAPALMKTYT